LRPPIPFMAYDHELAERIREALASVAGVTERKMFGGLAFLIQGRMTVVASSKGGLMICANPATTGDLVATTPAKLVHMSGRQMRGWLQLDAGDIRYGHELTPWIDHAINYSSNLYAPTTLSGHTSPRNATHSTSTPAARERS